MNPYRAEEYFVLQEEDVRYDVVVHGVRCDGERVEVSLGDGKVERFLFGFSDDLERSMFKMAADKDSNIKDVSSS